MYAQARSAAKQSLLKEGRRNSDAMLNDSFRRSSGASEKLQGILKNFRGASAEHAAHDAAPRPLGCLKWCQVQLYARGPR